jgi:peptide chain release factor 3
MDAAHHDRIAFLRVCSGKFEQGMKVLHHRTGKQMRISKATVFMAKDREGADEAYPGDIIGVHNHGTIKIGDTLSEGELLKFTGVPSFTPELFRLVQLDEPLRAKHLARGLHQLSEEGTIQVLRPIVGNDYLLGALGALQFEVTLARLEDEYGVRVHLRNTLFGAARWIDGEDHAKLEAFRNTYKENLAVDAQGDLVYLAESEWWMHRTIQAWPEIEFHTVKEHA